MKQNNSVSKQLTVTKIHDINDVVQYYTVNQLDYVGGEHWVRIMWYKFSHGSDVIWSACSPWCSRQTSQSAANRHRVNSLASISHQSAALHSNDDALSSHKHTPTHKQSTQFNISIYNVQSQWPNLRCGLPLEGGGKMVWWG